MSTAESVMGNSNAFDSNVYTEWALLLCLILFIWTCLLPSMCSVNGDFWRDIVQSLNS